MVLNFSYRMIFGFIMVAYISGCANTKSPLENMGDKLKTFMMPSNVSRIYIYRSPPWFPKSYGSNRLFVDGIPLGVLENGEFMVAEVAPGRHQVIDQHKSLVIPNYVKNYTFTLAGGQWSWINLASYGHNASTADEAMAQILSLKLVSFDNSSSINHIAEIRAVEKRKAAAERKATAERKITAERKAAAERKATAERKAAAERKATAERKTTAERKAAAERKATAERKAVAERKAAAERKAKENDGLLNGDLL